MIRTEDQNKKLWGLLKRHCLNNDSEERAKLANTFSEGRTDHTSELTDDECENLIKYLSETLLVKERTLERLRWRLWFVFSESKYEQFRYKNRNGKVQPNFTVITEYCKTHWNKTIADMSERELEKYIAIVKHWK